MTDFCFSHYVHFFVIFTLCFYIIVKVCSESVKTRWMIMKTEYLLAATFLHKTICCGHKELFCVDVLNCVRDFSCWLCIKTLKCGTEFIKDMWWGRSPKIEMKFVCICSLTVSLSKSTNNKLWCIMRFCINPLVPNVRCTHDTVWCSKPNVRYKCQPFNGLPYAAVIYVLASCLSHQTFNSNARRLIMKMDSGYTPKSSV